MGNPMLSRRSVSALLVLTAIVVALPVAVAQVDHSVVVETPSVTVEVDGPMLAPAAAEPLPHEPLPYHPAPVAQAFECCPIDVMGEIATFSAKRAYRCYGEPIQQVLCVDNPADCCKKLYSVPVCVPSCCVDTPVCVSSSVGLLGRGKVIYRWKCGFEAMLTFRVHGGVLIMYR